MDACLGLPMGTACLSLPHWERLAKHQDEALGGCFAANEAEDNEAEGPVHIIPLGLN